jgi:hypothetical protein
MKYIKLFENWINEENSESTEKPFNPQKPGLTNVLLIKSEDLTKNPNQETDIVKSIVDRIASKMGDKDMTVNIYKYYMGQPDYKTGIFPLYKNTKDSAGSLIWKPFGVGGETKGLLPFAAGKGPQEPKGDFYLETYIIPIAEDYVTKSPSAKADTPSPDILVDDKVLIIAKSDKKSKMAVNTKWWLWNHKKRQWELVTLGQIAMFGSSDFKDESYLTDAKKGSSESIAGFLELKDFYEKFAPEIEEAE